MKYSAGDGWTKVEAGGDPQAPPTASENVEGVGKVAASVLAVVIILGLVAVIGTAVVVVCAWLIRLMVGA